jgi:hypothetical protein
MDSMTSCGSFLYTVGMRVTIVKAAARLDAQHFTPQILAKVGFEDEKLERMHCNATC